MKYKLETNDNQDFWMAFHGSDNYFSLWDFDQRLRTITKHNPDNYTSDQVEMAQILRDELHDIMDEHNVNFNYIS